MGEIADKFADKISRNGPLLSLRSEHADYKPFSRHETLQYMEEHHSLTRRKVRAATQAILPSSGLMRPTGTSHAMPGHDRNATEACSRRIYNEAASQGLRKGSGQHRTSEELR
jgi:hypothetical protein